METAVMETIVETRREQAAIRLGVQIGQVETHRLEIAKLREAGLLIDLDIHGPSMFQTRTTYAELGITGDDIRAERLRRGSKDLFPKHAKKLRSLEARARQNLASHSFRIAAFGQWSWLPWTAYESFRSKHDQIVAEINTVKADILAEYEDIREQNRAYFAEVAYRAWKGMLSQYAPGSMVMIHTVDGVAFDSRNDYGRFVEYVVQKALGKMPLPEEIERVVRIDYRTSILYGEHELAAEEAALAEARAQEAEAKEREVDAKVKTWQAETSIEAFRQAEIEHARKQLADMGSPIQDALDGLRSNLYDAVKTLLDGLRKNDGFRGKASGKAAELYDYWRKLNGGLLQDAELDAALTTLNAEMKKYKGAGQNRDVHLGDVTSALTEIATLTNAETRKIRRQGPSRASELEF